MKRIIKAIKKYLLKEPLYFFLYVIRNMQHGYGNHCQFFTEEEITQLIKEGKSIIRLGDGEMSNIHFLSITPQVYGGELRSEYIHLIKAYNEHSRYVIGIPIYVNYTNNQLDKLGDGKKRLWMPLKVTFEMIFNSRPKYLDAHIFYRDGKFNKLILPSLKDKKVILITNAENIANTRNTAFANYITNYIECPSINAFEGRHILQDEVERIVKESGLPLDNFVILISAGSAKPVICEMANNGYQVLDIGTGYEGFTQNRSLEDRAV